MIGSILSFLGGLVGLASKKQENDARKTEIKADQAEKHRELSAPSGKPASWRNAIGWVSTAIVAYDFILRGLIIGIFDWIGYDLTKTLPMVDKELFYKLLFLMLGAVDL